MKHKQTSYDRNVVLSMINRKDYNSTKELLENILDVDKKNGEAWFFLGAIYGQQHDFAKAIFCSKQSILNNFNIEGAYFNIGVAQRATGKHREAMKSFRETIKANPLNHAAIEQFKQSWHELSHTQTLTVMIKGDIKICVPSTPELLTPYVLIEQEDWFENEIAFIRRFTQPGYVAIDIGANYGTYTFTMAKHCQPGGFIFAFEPVGSTVSYLEKSIKANDFDNVKVIPKAISNFEGESRIFLTENSEMNSLTRDELHNNSEEIHVTTLDKLTTLFENQDITLIKIDAEGEERRVIEGGNSFFSKHSPLVMMEIKHGSNTNIELLDDFQALGYKPYRLVPGLCVLTEYTGKDSADSIQLNIFCCKHDRAKQLRKQGLLVVNDDTKMDEAPATYSYWEEFSEQRNYTKTLKPKWAAPERPHNTEYLLALEHYARSQSESEPADIRYASLRKSLELAKQAISSRATLPRKLTIIRLYLELGYQGQAVSTLRNVMEHFSGNIDRQLDEPFIPPAKRFDYVPVGESLNEWLECSIFECMELAGKFTSYSSGVDDLARIENLVNKGYTGNAIERRYQLIRIRHGLGVSSRKSSVLSHELCLNHAFWEEQLDD